MIMEQNDMKRCSELPSLCPAFNIRAVSRVITQIFDEILKPTGLQITQFAVLVGVASLGSPSINQLAKGLVMDRTTLTRNLKPIDVAEYFKAAGFPIAPTHPAFDTS